MEWWIGWFSFPPSFDLSRPAIGEFSWCLVVAVATLGVIFVVVVVVSSVALSLSSSSLL